MSTQSVNFSFLERSENSVFFVIPHRVEIYEQAVTKYSKNQKIEILIEELKEKGPLIALGKFGPQSYEEEPFRLQQKVQGYDIYGWKVNSKHTHNSPQNYMMILGAKKIDDREVVFFTPSLDITPNSKSYFRKHIPSNIDSKIYVVSHKTFREGLFDLYPPKPLENSSDEIINEPSLFFVSSCPKSEPILSSFDKEFVKKLCSLTPLDSILDHGEGERKCKVLGQEIFDRYKKAANGNSFSGKEAVQRICDAIVFVASDGKLRKQYIELAWDRIGDENWRWMA